MAQQKLISINISLGSYQQIVADIISLAKKRYSSYVCVANVHMCIEAYNSKEFANIVNSADIVTADGKPLCVGLKLINGIDQERVAGMDLTPSLLKEAELNNIKVFLYGSTDEVLDKIQKVAKEKYPNLAIVGAISPPFRVLSEAEIANDVNTINDSGAGLILVALGCPKQERWMYSMKGKIQGVMVGVGGAFPVFAGIQPRAPKWMQDYSLEWLHRLSQDPKRLFKRYFVTNSLFISLLIKEKLRTI
ncbi:MULTISPECIES: WecB/TagA/CpsF family glycosyltransferase [unclassified Arcicella]|uniref:WecB/TagA/CpsF family glycosyltransferase n=1 Tax=unclassified Arcicella TaxID=2644986 RepID=UPI00286214B7|nr:MULTISPECIES: WecB/TagA/CpsF family glycosyltransferase [unclassified Arcicella]MDR6564812.1 N-acetylglucosaminyldiphosphoundecaprenol N-acetyl-beta-D-mannosaminyltransferase [Arcicella sp. BE51]MDR6814608.1 N-acetylglucosaminyldiphosphoundecaprenol N-acetyl-beta-D-mannosaminyltransferase [Arcicella sp. BE140]MDR6825986.1 N-acetylglucosaminyldiphosphoundecaprenol N-acetyl-beta-D-mannosaminyltransferase [Arcicella sp. BE139]